MGRLLTIGETLGVAVTETGDPLRTARTLRLSTAGAESTVAIGMRRLGHEAAWVGVVGEDEIGARVLRDLAAEGVDTQFARVDPDRPTGFMIRELRTAEYTRVTYYRDRSAGSGLAQADVEAALTADSGPDLVHLTGITPALSATCADAVRRAVELASRARIPISFDVNYRSTLSGSSGTAALVKELLPQIDILFVGDDELALATDETDLRRAARGLLTRGPDEVVVKRGADGALAVSADGAEVEHSAVRVRVVDVIGAGDSFTAGYLAARCDGLPLADRLHWATIAAACTVGTHGDWEGLPTRADLRHRGGGSVTVR
ncbi:MAG TPA: sugar kinase [Actinocrinis sp.]|jgi:2-dehydro-3-deoxygluconokinase|uniref:sugar kinase n=1 Tax=Actinocrinis sp. TaxID=1920516 RepID=UPI002DDC92EF|nr:sugar kinase [Actinocrinis sp.]HEV3173867.1 sugar kinase [Actinocrinis sp.]